MQTLLIFISPIWVKLVTIGARPRTAGGYMTNGELTQKQEDS